MIVGIGSDLCDIRRIERVLERHGERFLARVFTADERARAERRQGSQRIATYAKRWAAKEACAKALGTGFAAGVHHSLIGVVNLASGAPTLSLAGGALVRLRLLTPPGMHPRIALTMSDEPPYAFAAVVIEAASDKTLPLG